MSCLILLNALSKLRKTNKSVRTLGTCVECTDCNAALWLKPYSPQASCWGHPIALTGGIEEKEAMRRDTHTHCCKRL